jgi:hypothetical protein
MQHSVIYSSSVHNPSYFSIRLQVGFLAIVLGICMCYRTECIKGTQLTQTREHNKLRLKINISCGRYHAVL